jgi:hypothetical protein
MEHEYRATIRWERDGDIFSDNRYSRFHLWTFDGGVTVPASASPSVVQRRDSSSTATRIRRLAS